MSELHSESSNKKVRHILSLSGGKDSTALAIYMKDRIAEMEYVFCDTGSELRETYEYLDKIEKFLGKPIVRLNSGKPFEYWLEVHSGYLPSPRARWCTRYMKIIPFERYIGEDTVYSYIGIRGDEDRQGYISSRSNIIPKYPFKEDGITKKDVYDILEKSGLGLPEYYKWRSRSGCYFCFFQQKIEWVGLLENHPDLFEKSKKFEKLDPKTGRPFTWVAGRFLGDIEGEKESIKEKKANARPQAKKAQTLFEMYKNAEASDDEDEDQACLICHL